LFSVEKAISTEIAVFLIKVDILKEVTEEVRQTKCNSSLARERILNIVANIARKIEIRLLSTSITHQLHLLTAT